MSLTCLGVSVDVNTEFEAVIGLEVHVQLATDSKIFSSARARPESGNSVADEAVNKNTTPVCAGHPGTLPVLNEKAVGYAVRAGLATGCKINLKSIFARKHYFYPDSPKGYQISQYDLPLCEKGFLDIELGDEGEITKRIGITRIHMEEDAGKSLHLHGYSLVNLNRAGVPLIEVVSEPEMRSPLEAGAYLRKLYAIVTAIGVCDGNLQEGNFRCDANVSIRPKGVSAFGTRTEIKNVNSFRFVEKAIEYEVERQRQVILSGGTLVQETRLYDSQKNRTFSMRTKEDAEDYRYFPDPDLPPLVLSPQMVEAIRAALPELPDQKRDRYMRDYFLRRLDAILLSSGSTWGRMFEESVALTGKEQGKILANLMIGEGMRLVSEAESNPDAQNAGFTSKQFADLARAVSDQTVSVTAAKQVLAIAFKEGGEVGAIIDREGLRQVSDLSALEPVIEEIIAKNPKQVEEYRSGKEKVLGFFVGQAMKATQGKANPALLQELVVKKLKG
ncbi:MAG: Asp-tRNA(Asn)/Glu-tRNA(Gln) amidotransferase subunit GatB [Bdellovibrionales bacterium]|nr:Asp-tRNA(Asn)/Glu-tRNA(Gln) amidotransferase subunit GatB [Bdellovibrionales bacterium]